MTLSLDPDVAETGEERFKILDRAIELGCTYIDSADCYIDNEELLGQYFKKNPHQREKVFLATKFGINEHGEDPMDYSIQGDAQYVREAFEKSIKRLGLDYVDLYYVHRIDKNVPIEETIETLKELVKAGKVKYLGLSECSSDTLRRAHAVHPIACVQVEYSPISLDIEENGLLKACRELGVAIVCYSPLGKGMFTETFKAPSDLEEDDWRKEMPRFSDENFSKNLQIVNQLRALATKKGCSLGQLTLAWILAQGDDFIPIPGTTKIKNLEDNAGAAQVKLNKEDEEEVRAICKKIGVAGDRVPEDMAGEIYADSAPKKN